MIVIAVHRGSYVRGYTVYNLISKTNAGKNMKVISSITYIFGNLHISYILSQLKIK